MTVDITSLSIKIESSGIREASNALGGLSTSAGNAEKRTNALVEATKKMVTQDLASANALNSYMDKLKQQTALMKSLTTNNAGAAASTASLTTAITALSTSIGNLTPRTIQASQAQRQHNESMKEAHALARGLAGAMGALWVTYGNFAGMAVGVAIGATLKGILKLGMEVEKQLNFVFALSEKGEKVNLDNFLAITGSSVQSVVDAANAMRMLAQNGLSVSQSLSALPSILNLATVGEMNVGQAAISATGAVSAFGLELSDIGYVTDIFAKTAATSNTSVLAMTESMKQASTVASLFNVSIEQTAAMLGLLAKINITGGAAGTSLTNMLTGLYEPTDQAKKAMERLGVTAFESNGKMKNMTILLEDIKRAASSLSDQAKADIFGDMVTARGMKSLILATENLDKLKEKTLENSKALGFMKDVVEKLEDDSAHAFKRMGVIIDTEFVRAFMNAAPEVQKLGQALGDLFKSSGAQRMNTMTGQMERETTAIANLVKNLAIAANFIVEHVAGVSAMVGAYTLWRLAVGYTVVQQTALGVSTATLGTLFGAWRTAVVTSTAATLAHATAVGVLDVARAKNIGTIVMSTAVTETNTAATLAASAASKSFMAFLLPALGFLGIALAAAAALWLVFRDNTSDATDANTKMSNSIHVIEEQLTKEEERLKRVIGLWNDRKKAFDESTTVAPEKIFEAQSTLNRLKAQIEQQLGRKTGANEITQQFMSSQNMYTSQGRAVGLLAEEYLKAKANLGELQGQQARGLVVSGQSAYVKTIEEIAAFRTKVEEFRKEADSTGSKGTKDHKDYLITNPKERELRLSLGGKDGILAEIDKINTSKDIAKPQLEAAQKRVRELQVDFKKLQEEINNTKRVQPPDPDKSTVKDGMYKQLAEAQTAIDNAKKKSIADQEAAQSEYKRGIIGEIGLIERVKEAELDKQVTIGLAAIEKTRILLNYKDQSAAFATEMANRDQAVEAGKAAIATAANKRSELEVANQSKLLRFEADKFESQKKYAKAYEAEFAAKHATDSDRMMSNIAFETDLVRKGELEKVKAYQDTAYAAGLASAQNRDAVNDFSVAAEATRNELRGIQTATEGQGLAAMFDAATEASARFAADLPALRQKMGNITDPKALNEAQAQLTNLAETQRKLWVGVGESISDSLGSAFGNAGKAAGELLMVAVRTGQTQQKLASDKDTAINASYALGKEMGHSEEVIAKRNGNINLDFANKERSTRIKGYGDMAGAAKSFFKEGSTGYKVMEGAEKAFRLVELAGLAESLAVTVTTAAAKAIAYIPTFLMAWGSLGPWGLAAGGVALAAILGGAFSGGGGAKPMSAADRQDKAGKGSVLGDSDAKSESITNSLAIMERNSGLGLVHSGQMTKSLNIIASSLGNLSSLVLRTSGIRDGKVAGIKEGTEKNLIASFIGGGLIGVVANFIPGLDKIMTKLFGTKTSIKDQGIKIGSASLGSIDSFGVSAQSYADVETRKKFLGATYSKKTNTQTGALPQEISDQFTLVVKNLASGVGAAADMLGLGGDAFTNKMKTFIIDIGEISIKGLSSEEIQKQFEAVFSKLGDDMAKFGIVGLEKFQKIGEGYFETLARVANDLIQVKDVFAVMGQTFSLTGLAAVGVSQSFIVAAGGLEKLTGGTKSFIDTFFTEAEKMGPITASVVARLAELKMSELTTLEIYKNKVKALNLTNVEDQKLYAALIELAPAFKESADYATKLAEGTVELTKAQQKALDIATKQRELDIRLMEAQGKELEALNARRSDELSALTKLSPALAETQKAIYAAEDANKRSAKARSVLDEAYKRESSALQSVIDKFKKFSESLKEFKASLMLGDLSTMSPEQKYLESKRQFETTSMMAAAGDEKALGDLQKTSQEFLNFSRSYNASTEAYTKDFNLVQDALTAGAFAADQQVAIAQSQLTIMDAQYKTILRIEELLTFKQAMSGMTGGGGGGKTFDSDLAKSQIAKYGFGDSDGWSGDIFARETIEKMKAASSGVNGSHYNGLDSVPFDGYTAKMHKGERIQTAKAANASDVNSAELVKLTTEMLERISRMEEHAAASNAQRGAIAEVSIEQMDALGNKMDGLKKAIKSN